MAEESPRRTAKDFDPEVLKLFDKYVHGAIDRRGFLDGAARFAVGGVTAAGLAAVDAGAAAPGDEVVMAGF